MIQCSECGNYEYDVVHRSKIIRMIERLRKKQYTDTTPDSYMEKDLDAWAITYLLELIE